ncbi:hypothetical protein [Comamonas kerstersii]|uniref:hypothetical protein n=1 Tax=Comamonas kerstersii TaxID=225992 RepID=UPI000A87BCF1|nr:hypothetical protein [Comamonas kerstersii]
MNELVDMGELVKSARNGNFSQESSNDLISSALARLWNNCSQNGLSISNICIGDNVVINANAVVNFDVPDNAKVYAQKSVVII